MFLHRPPSLLFPLCIWLLIGRDAASPDGGQEVIEVRFMHPSDVLAEHCSKRISAHQKDPTQVLQPLGLMGLPMQPHATENGATFWMKVVGVDGVCMCNHTLFCVLGWGGMEVV